MSAETVPGIAREHAGRSTSLAMRVALGALPVVLALLLWTLIVVCLRHWRDVAFPGPIETLTRLWAMVTGQDLLGHSIWVHATASLGRWAAGFLLGSILAVATATLIGWSWFAEKTLMPLVYALQLIPGLAWIPIAILLLGINNRATIFMITVTALGPVTVNMVAGIKSASEQHLRVARMAGARPADLFVRVLLPGSIPHLMSGLRVGIGNSWRVVVAAEMVVGSGSGLGYSIIQSRWTLDYTSAFVCIGFICLVGLLIEYVAFTRIEAATVRRWGMVRDGAH